MAQMKSVVDRRATAHTRNRYDCMAPIYDMMEGIVERVVDPMIQWLTGVHIARQTVDNVRMAGWRIENVDSLSPGQVFRPIQARKITA